MAKLKPVSGLLNYNEVLQAALRLMNEFSKGRKSGEERGWLLLEYVEEMLLK